MKRLLDIALSAIMLLLTGPLFAVCSLGIKLQDGGPVFFKQIRWGRGGTKFVLYKFRSMSVAPPDEVVRSSRRLEARVTRFGGFMRVKGLDELPQLINIVKGDMSFVGPRAVAVDEIIDSPDGDIRYEDFPGFPERLSVRPGLTGPATIYLSKDVDPTTKFEYDLEYIKNRSMWVDLRLIALSVWISIRGKWESADRKY